MGGSLSSGYGHGRSLGPARGPPMAGLRRRIAADSMSCCSLAPVVITISGYALQGDLKMVTIRLTRRGGKKTPFYHVVVTDSRKRQGGTSLESVGLFNPVARGAEVKLRLNVARIEHWVAQGAHMSDRVTFLLTSFRKQAA